MKMSAIKPEPVSVEFDGPKGRQTKTFADPHKAKSFYVSKEKAGKQPAVKAGTLDVNGAAKPKPKDAAPKKASVARDELGARKGSQAAKINAALSRKPQESTAVAEATKLDAGRVRAHLKYLVAKKLCIETAEGFKLK